MDNRPSGTLYNIMQHTSNMVSQQTDKQTKLPAIGNYIICLKSHLKTKLYIEIFVCKYTGKKINTYLRVKVCQGEGVGFCRIKRDLYIICIIWNF